MITSPPRTCLGESDDVVARHSQRDGLRLDGRGRGVARLLNFWREKGSNQKEYKQIALRKKHDCNQWEISVIIIFLFTIYSKKQKQTHSRHNSPLSSAESNPACLKVLKGLGSSLKLETDSSSSSLRGEENNKG